MKEKSKELQILEEYIEKEKELNKMYDEEDGIDVNSPNYEPNADLTMKRIFYMIEYKNVRTKQAYLSKITNGNWSVETRSMMADLDKRRRDVHNLALNSLLGMNDLAKKMNWTKLYEGEILTEAQINSHKELDGREEMTNFFLKLLVDIEDQSLENIEKNMVQRDVRSLKDGLYKIERDYKVKQGLTYDDGDIEFEDER